MKTGTRIHVVLQGFNFQGFLCRQKVCHPPGQDHLSIQVSLFAVSLSAHSQEGTISLTVVFLHSTIYISLQLRIRIDLHTHRNTYITYLPVEYPPSDW